MKPLDFEKKQRHNPIHTIFFGHMVPQRIFRIYFAIVLLGAFLLMLPISIKENTSIRFIDALFTSASAFSDTGLSVKVTVDTFTFFGQLVLLILIQFGGIGLMTLKIMIALALGRKISIGDKAMLSAERGLGKLGGSMKYIITIIKMVFAFQLLLAILFGFRFYFSYFHNPNYAFYENFWKLIWHSIFHAVSAVNNAGFDIIGANSFTPFATDYFIQTLVMVGLIFGGIGFPVLYDVRNYFRSRKTKEPFKFSLFTKICFRMYFSVLIVGLALVFGFELLTSNGILYNQAYTLPQRIFYLVFHTVSTRNAGFATVDMNQFSIATRLVFAIMMWIGASPVSTAGGIRTTTFFLAILAIFRVIKREDHINVYNKRIPLSTMERSLVVIVVSQILILGAVMVMLVSMTHSASFMSVFFEACSAFGTTGLTMGITSNLGVVGKIAIILLMFIGQQGVTTTLLMWNDTKPSISQPQLVEEDILIG